MVESGRERGLLAEIAGEPQQRDARIRGGDGRQRVPRAVAAAVVDVEDAAVDVGQRFERRGEPRVEQRQRLLLVEGAQADRQAVASLKAAMTRVTEGRVMAAS